MQTNERKIKTPPPVAEALKTYLRGNATIRRAFKLDLDKHRVDADLRQVYAHIAGTQTLDTHTLSHIAQAAQWLTGGNKWGLILMGSVGNGKTTLQQSIDTLLRFYRDQRIATSLSLKYVKATDLAKWATARATDDAAREYNGCKTTRMLLLDDLGEEASEVLDYGTVKTPVSDVLMHRYENWGATVITTNLDTEDFTAQVWRSPGRPHATDVFLHRFRKYFLPMIPISNSDVSTIIRAASSLRKLRPDNIRQANAIRMILQISNKLINRTKNERTERI